MKTVTAESDRAMSEELPCHGCGYDLRAHPEEGVRPECGASVAEARQWAAIPRRPAWNESDPRWRRRMLAGVWVLVLIPLMDLLQKLGWASLVPVPTFLNSGPFSLEETFLCSMGVYPLILFCIGTVLFFSKERGHRPSRLDWTRRWGIICTYVVALLSTAITLFMPALVLAGISAIFMAMPLKYQPGVTPLFGELGWIYLRYGPLPKGITYCVLVTFSWMTILLACVPLWEALCSSGSKRFAKILLAPLALFALMNIAEAGLLAIGYLPLSLADPFFRLGPYFRPAALVWNTAGFRWALGWIVTPQPGLNLIAVEVIKWSIIFAIAVGLSVAQLAAWRKKRTARHANNAGESQKC